MKGSDYLGFGLALSFGLWWLLFPAAVLKFYTWLHRGRAKLPQPSGVRIAGSIWVLVVLAVFAVLIMR
jgi:hypothetical protein